MTEIKTKLDNLEKQVNKKTGDDKITAVTVDWTTDNGRTIEDQAKERALAIGETVHCIYRDDKDEIQTYTYNPKLKRGWHK